MATPRPYQNDTIGDMADRACDGWLWASCPLPCGRSVAVPLAYFVERYGRDRPAEMIFAALRCSSCGGHPTTFTLPSTAATPAEPDRRSPIPWDSVPEQIRAALGHDDSHPSSESEKPAGGPSGSAS